MDLFDWTIVIAAVLLITAGLSIAFVSDGRYPIPLIARVGGVGVTLLGVSCVAQVIDGAVSGSPWTTGAVAVLVAAVLLAIAVAQHLHQRGMMFHVREARRVTVMTRIAHRHRARLHSTHGR